MNRSDRIKAFSARKAQRYSRIGRQFEEDVLAILADMQGGGLIDSFVKHAPNSDEDEIGMDFTVRKGPASVSFGVTISRRSYNRSKNLHLGTPQMLFPIGTNKTTICNKILRLLQDQSQ